MTDGPRRGRGLPSRPVVTLVALLGTTLVALLGATTPVPAAVAADPTRVAVAADPTRVAHAAVVHTRTAVRHRQASRSATRPETDDPLAVSLDVVSPAVLPQQGPVTLRGTVTNSSTETWTTVRVYPFLSHTPITTVADLAAAAETDPDLVPGGRVVELQRPATYATIARIRPGQSASYTVRIPHRLLDQAVGTAPGVYWIGVQALGADAEGRDEYADGRAFSFIPRAGGQPTPTQVAVVVPVRHAVGFDQEGALRGIPAWNRDLSPDGRLSALLDLGSAAPAGSLTWLVDPAVLDALRRIGLGNPVRSLLPQPSGTASSSPTDGASDGAGAGASDGAGATAGERVPVSPTLAARARTWLQRFVALAGRDTVLGLPYGDLDVAAAVHLDPDAVTRATALSAATFSDLGIAALPTVSSPSGWLSPTTVTGLADTSGVLASSEAVSGLPARAAPPARVLVGGRAVDLSDAAASTGGPGPGDPTSLLGLRQRLLAEAGLRSLRRTPPPLVVTLPDDWHPGTSLLPFFSGLTVPWLTLVGLPAVSSPDPPTIPVAGLDYPEREADAELPGRSFTAAETLRAAGAALQTLLQGPTDIGSTVSAESLTATSYDDRDDPRGSAARAQAATSVLEGSMGQVKISAPPYVTLSSTSNNRFRVDLTNELHEAVRIRIKPVVDAGLTIGTPGIISLEGGGRTSVLLTVRSGRLGYHQVDLELTNVKGVRLGSHATLPIRSSRTGRVIWFIIAAGAALLFGAILARLIRRFRRHRASVRAAR